MPDYCVPTVTNLPVKGTRGAKRKRVVVVTNPGANSLEYIGPMQVFMEANFFLENSGRSDLGYDVEVVSTRPGTIYNVKGFSIVTDTPYHRLRGSVDTLMFQAADEHDCALEDASFIRWVSRMSRRVRRITSICAGTYFLAAAGVLDGRRATTHWCAVEDFRRRYPRVDLDPDPIYIRDGNVYTSAGATAGLDLALALIEEDYGGELARRVAQGLVMYMKRPGNQAQFSVQVSTQFPEEERIGELQAYVSENPDGDLSVESLAERVGMSPRNFARVFAREVGMPPGKFVEQIRLERARHHLEQTDVPLSQVAKRCGYRTADGMRAAFERSLGVSPREYRQRFSSSVAR